MGSFGGDRVSPLGPRAHGVACGPGMRSGVTPGSPLPHQGAPLSGFLRTLCLSCWDAPRQEEQFTLGQKLCLLPLPIRAVTLQLLLQPTDVFSPTILCSPPSRGNVCRINARMMRKLKIILLIIHTLALCVCMYINFFSHFTYVFHLILSSQWFNWIKTHWWLTMRKAPLPSTGH